MDSLSYSRRVFDMASQHPSAEHQVAAGGAATQRVAVKFSAHALKQAGSSVSSLALSLTNEVARSAASSTTNVRIEPLITSQPPDAVAKLVKQAAHLDPTYTPTDFGSWFQLFFDVVADAENTNTGGDRYYWRPPWRRDRLQRRRPVRAPLARPA
jgi:hypothetical protein